MITFKGNAEADYFGYLPGVLFTVKIYKKNFNPLNCQVRFPPPLPPPRLDQLSLSPACPLRWWSLRRSRLLPPWPRPLWPRRWPGGKRAGKCWTWDPWMQLDSRKDHPKPIHLRSAGFLVSFELRTSFDVELVHGKSSLVLSNGI